MRRSSGSCDEAARQTFNHRGHRGARRSGDRDIGHPNRRASMCRQHIKEPVGLVVGCARPPEIVAEARDLEHIAGFLRTSVGYLKAAAVICVVMVYECEMRKLTESEDATKAAIAHLRRAVLGMRVHLQPVETLNQHAATGK
jgi:hypothetical protein